MQKIGAVVVIVILVLVGLYIADKNGLLNSGRESIFEGGKFYTSKKFGFEIQYPKTWAYLEIKEKGEEPLFSLQEDELFRVNLSENGNANNNVSVRIYASDNLSLGGWREKRLQKSDREKEECRRKNPTSICLAERDFIRGSTKTTFLGEEAYQLSIAVGGAVTDCTQAKKGKYVYDICQSANSTKDAQKVARSFTFLE